MSDWLTFLWFVGTCNLCHPAMGPQEALWNMVEKDKMGKNDAALKNA